MNRKPFITGILTALVILFSLTVSACMGGLAADKDVYYSINYESEHGTVPKNKKVLSGTILKAQDLPPLTAEDYKFEGWYIDDDKITADSAYKVTTDITLKAKWEICNIHLTATPGEQGIILSWSNLPEGTTRLSITCYEAGQHFSFIHTYDFYTKDFEDQTLFDRFVTPGTSYDYKIFAIDGQSDFINTTAIGGIGGMDIISLPTAVYDSQNKTLNYSAPGEFRYQDFSIIRDSYFEIDYLSSDYTAYAFKIHDTTTSSNLSLLKPDTYTLSEWAYVNITTKDYFYMEKTAVPANDNNMPHTIVIE